MWVTCGAQWWVFLWETYLLVRTWGWGPCPMMRDLCLQGEQLYASWNLAKFCLQGRVRPLCLVWDFPWWLRWYRICMQCRRTGFISGSGRSPGEGNGNWIQYSYLQNPMGRGGWRATIHVVTNSQTCLKDEYFDFSILSALIMFRQDCLLSAMRILTPDHVLCAWGRGDLGGDWAWPLSWKTPCLCLNVSAQRSGVWSWGGLLWVSAILWEGFHGPPRAQCCNRDRSLSSCQAHLPWGSWRLLRWATGDLFQFFLTFSLSREAGSPG